MQAELRAVVRLHPEELAAPVGPREAAADERAAASIAVELAARSSSRVQPMAAIPLDVYLERLSPEDPEP